MGAYCFARSGGIGAGLGVHGDRVLLVAVRARQVNQDVEWSKLCIRLSALFRLVQAIFESLRFLARPFSVV